MSSRDERLLDEQPLEQRIMGAAMMRLLESGDPLSALVTCLLVVDEATLCLHAPSGVLLVDDPAGEVQQALRAAGAEHGLETPQVRVVRF